MGDVNNVEHWFLWVINVAVLVTCGVALLDAVRRPAAAFIAHGKLTKPIWCAILAVATLVALGGFVSFLGSIALIAALVYLVDVKPALSGSSSW